MGIKLDQNTNTYNVSFSKRHPITKQPITLRRIGIQTKVDAQKVHRELLDLVYRKIHVARHPIWRILVEKFLAEARLRGLYEKTLSDYESCLRAATFDCWADRTCESITTQEIRALMYEKYSEHSPSHQQNFLSAFWVADTKRPSTQGICSLSWIPKSRLTSVLI